MSEPDPFSNPSALLPVTLRDFFAAHALTGLLAASEELPIPRAVEDAFLIADSMLRERSKQPPV